MIRKSLSLLLIGFSVVAVAQKKKKDEPKNDYFLSSSQVGGLSFRCIGPALTSGRVADIAVNPNNFSEYYVAVASGGVWKTTNHGTSFEPIFDGQSSYSIGCVTIDPNNDQTIWVGTGENNNQRSVAYGDGVYKSTNGGASWKNMGLKESEHISKVIVDPRNSDVVYVCAYGPLWSEGGERGVYKSVDGGENWERIHYVSDNTGAADLIMDPSNPDILYVAMHQRRRHVFTYIGGGEESGVFKTEDGGKTWYEIEKGLPSGKMGRVGLAVSPADPNYMYAIVEAEDGSGGFYRSINKGENWTKRSGYSTSGNYYQEIICDPVDRDKVFSMNTWLRHTEDGGLNFKSTGESKKHVDNHTIWINPTDTDHWIVGCDGGIYETYNHAKDWDYKPNLPITQFYKVAVDNDVPFYNVYGGTQDNNSLGGPSRTINNAGILNSDWYITNGGDGFESQIDPKDPNIVYAQAQYGWLVRYDRQSGEKIGIQPMPKKGEPAYRWNWDAPLVVSNHEDGTIYFAANKVFKSTDRGNTWSVISEDLSRQLDRNQLKVMGQIQRPEVVMKNKSTTIFGNIVALDESPKKSGLLYAGTDDGLVHITENDGGSWVKKESFPGVPSMTYVNMLLASRHDENRVYAAFNNHKKGDFKPYLLRSDDKGNTWTSIAGDLPERGSVYAIAEDHELENLLFAGTEFGVFFSINGGENWIQLKSGLPTIAIRDIAIQRRENDLVLATFGRGFYVLDDYSPLRHITEEAMNQPAMIFPIKDGLEYIQSNPLGLRGVGSQGAGFYSAENPTFGVTFTYFIKDGITSPKDERIADQNQRIEDGLDIEYPSYEDFVAEDNYEDPFVLFVIKDELGNEVRKIKGGLATGINRVSWNLRYPTTTPLSLRAGEVGRYSNADEGPLVLPGKYTVELYLNNNGAFSQLVTATPFNVKTLENSSLARQSEEVLAFKTKLSELRRKMRGTGNEISEYSNRLKYIRQAIIAYPNTELSWMSDVQKLEDQVHDVEIMMWGDWHKSSRDVETLDGAAGKLETIVYQCWYSTSNITSTQKEQYEIADDEYVQIRKLVDDIKAGVVALEAKLDSKGVPYTPGRPDWKEE
ncbi:MAG: glycosyl hydrolase [Crocinitomicaceae bacterium]|nr:glycosyl hydrolase [Crocinitomicaceae bacterium]